MKNNDITIITRYTFEPYFNGYWQQFNWYDANGKQLVVKHYNGCNCVVSCGKKYGIKKLRTFAKVEQVLVDNDLPF